MPPDRLNVSAASDGERDFLDGECITNDRDEHAENSDF